MASLKWTERLIGLFPDKGLYMKNDPLFMLFPMGAISARFDNFDFSLIMELLPHSSGAPKSTLGTEFQKSVNGLRKPNVSTRQIKRK